MTGHSLFAALAFGTAVTLTSGAAAADLRLLDTHPEGCNALLTGKVAAGDTDSLRALLPASEDSDRYITARVTLCLDSPGGSFAEGLALARHLRHAGIATHVPAGAACLSACALAFLGGSQLGAEDAITHRFQRSIHATARLGFHAPALDIPSGAFSETEVRSAFSLALQASALIFTRLDELGIDRAFALAFFEVPEDVFYEIDTPERAEEADVTVTGTAPPPRTIGAGRLVDLCARNFERFDPRTYENPDMFTVVLRTDVMDLPPNQPGDQRAVVLLATTGEGMLMWDACEVDWAPGTDSAGFLRLTHHELFDFDFLDFENPRPMTRPQVLAQLGQRVLGTQIPSPMMALPEGTPLRSRAEAGPPRATALADTLCTPVHASYEVHNVQSFTNLRSAPGFEGAVLAEVPRGARVTPVSADFDSTRLLSDTCRAACRPSLRGRLTTGDVWQMRSCRSSDDVWWQVRTRDGATGWLSSRFLKQ